MKWKIFIGETMRNPNFNVLRSLLLRVLRSNRKAVREFTDCLIYGFLRRIFVKSDRLLEEAVDFVNENHYRSDRDEQARQAQGFRAVEATSGIAGQGVERDAVRIRERSTDRA
jgi:hypothetical protein